MPKEKEELTGIIQKVIWKSDDNSRVIAALQPDKVLSDDPFHPKNKNGPVVIGNAPHSGLIEGQQYVFRGRWEFNEDRKVNQFMFDSSTEKLVLNRHGVTEYLKRYAPYIGDVIANRIIDRYGSAEAINRLKSTPKEVAKEVQGLTESVSVSASVELIKAEKFQETRVQLLDLIANNGFSEKAISASIEKWGVMAPSVIKRDPFKLMTAKISGAGFLRCDKLWMDFGLPPDKMKRQVMAIWYHLKSDSSGSTWFSKPSLIATMRRLLTGTIKPERAVAIAIRAKMITQTERDGVLWVAESKKAEEESDVAFFIAGLMKSE